MVIGNPYAQSLWGFRAMGEGRRLVAQSVRVGNARIARRVDDGVIANGGYRTWRPKAH
jgi:hypothetical protein